MFQRILAVLFYSFFITSTALASDTPAVEYHYYDISTDSAKELKDILKERPAHVSWNVEWDFSHKRRSFVWKPVCNIRYIKTKPHITVYKHRLTPAPKKDSTIGVVWQQYLQRIESYERVQVKNALKASEAVQTTLHDMESVPNCVLLRKKAHELAAEVASEYHQKAKELEFTTFLGHMSLVGIEIPQAGQYSTHQLRYNTTPLSFTNDSK